MMKRSIMVALSLLAAATGAQAQFSHTDFGSTDGLKLIGAVRTSDEALSMTPDAGIHTAAIWSIDKQGVQEGFTTSFRLRISTPGGISDELGNPGADGLAFVIQNSNGGAIGGPGHRIGYDGIPNSVAVEFDTWFNRNLGDPSSSHISVQSRGALPNSCHQQSSLGVADAEGLSDGEVHSVMIHYTPGRLSIYLDEMNTPLVSVQVDLARLLKLDNGRAWVGFTSATASAWERHDILSWSLDPGNKPTATLQSEKRISAIVSPPIGVTGELRASGNAMEVFNEETTIAAKRPHLAKDASARLESFPNPVTETLGLEYETGTAGHIRILLHDMLGKPVMTLVDGDHAAGTYKIEADLSKLASGNYLCVLQTPAGRLTREIRVVR